MSQVIYLSQGANESDIAAALALMNNGGTLVLPKDSYIEIRDGINVDIARRDITIDLNGSTLKQAADVTVISAAGAIGTAQSVALNTSGANATITYTTVPANVRVGDWIKVVSDDILPSDNRNSPVPTRLGQAMQVTAIDGSTVTLAGEPLYADLFVTNVRAATMTSGTFKLVNGTVEGDQTDGTWLSYLVNVRNGIGTRIDHLTVKDGNSMGINLVNNVNALVTEAVAMNLRDDTAIGWYGYGVHSGGSLNTTVVGLYAEQVRHATDDNNVGSPAGDGDLTKFGADINMTVTNTVSYYASAFSYSWHSEGRNGVLDNVMSFYSHGFVGVRGVGNKVLNSASVGDERAFQFFEYGYGDSKDTVVDNVTVREAGIYVYHMQGNPTNNLIKNSYLEYDYRPGDLGTTLLVNTTVVKTDGVDDDTIAGTGGPDRLLGGRGYDVLSGGDGDDYIWGGLAADTLTGGAGSDRFVFDQLDSTDTVTDFQAGAGGDKLDVSILGARHGWKGDYVLNGYVTFVQSGANTLLQATSDHVTIAVLLNVQAADIVSANIQQTISGSASSYTTPPPATVVLDPGSTAYAKGVTIAGTTNDDLINATHSVGSQALPTIRADSITGGSGNDYIDGLGGADNINAGNGNDTVLYYGGVKSTLQGGSGRDVLVINTTDVIDLSAADQSEGLPVVSGFDDVDGRAATFGLTIYGDKNNSNIWGGSGDDRISGGGGNDRIDGGAGMDVALLDGNRDDYSFIRINDFTWRAQDLRYTAGAMRTYYYNFEQVSFADQFAFIDTLNRPPTDITLSNATVAENAPAGTLIGTLIGIDPDVSEINTFTILNDAAGVFQIVGYSLFAAQPLDAETVGSYDLEVRITDSDFHTIDRTIKITVGDLNDNAPVITSPAAITASENQILVTELAATDVDTTGEATTFSIKTDTGDGALFRVSGTRLEFINAPDFEDVAHAPTYSVTIIASDGVNTSERMLNVSINDVRTGDTFIGTAADENFSYMSDVSYDRIDGGNGTDLFSLTAGAVAIGATSGGDVTLDLGRDGSIDFALANVERVVVLGGDHKIAGSLAATALAAGDLTLIGTGVADQLDGTLAGVRMQLYGEGGSDVLIGDVLDDLLDGGQGNDTMSGGFGDDIYVVDSSSDTVKESAGQGYDTIKTLLTSYSLATNFEALVFTGTAAFTGNGNSVNNQLTGGTGNDKLDGKAGVDTMSGGLGDDTYTVDNVGDLVVEFGSAGTDTVKSYITYTLGANVEKLSLVGTAAKGMGNALANSINGNAANNELLGFDGKDTLSGGGGDDVLVGGFGGDTLTGGAGADHFRFDVLETSTNKDTIKDFAHGVDHLEFGRSAFEAFVDDPAGTLSPLDFGLGIAATTPRQHLIYNQLTGALYYDADGMGGQAQVQIALLSTKPQLDASDIVLI